MAFTAEVDEDTTVVGVRAELKFMTDSDPAEGLGGYCALMILPREFADTDGFGTSQTQNWFSNSTVDCINDSSGDHWAIAPFCTPGRAIDSVLLAPSTKRIVRKGEKLVVLVRAGNFTALPQFLKLFGTITVFTLEQ